jgi:hypothetical protein
VTKKARQICALSRVYHKLWGRFIKHHPHAVSHRSRISAKNPNNHTRHQPTFFFPRSIGFPISDYQPLESFRDSLHSNSKILIPQSAHPSPPKLLFSCMIGHDRSSFHQRIIAILAPIWLLFPFTCLNLTRIKPLSIFPHNQP